MIQLGDEPEERPPVEYPPEVLLGSGVETTLCKNPPAEMIESKTFLGFKMPKTVMSPKAFHEATVLKHIYPDCYIEVDGCWVWAPRPRGGAYTQGTIATVAHILAAANRKWSEQVRKDLG